MSRAGSGAGREMDRQSPPLVEASRDTGLVSNVGHMHSTAQHELSSSSRRRGVRGL